MQLLSDSDTSPQLSQRYTRVITPTSLTRSHIDQDRESIGLTSQSSSRSSQHSSALFPDSSFADLYEVCIVQIVNSEHSVLDVALGRLVAGVEALDSSTASPRQSKTSSEQLEHVYQLEKLGYHRQAAREAMRAVESNLQKNGLSQANDLLVSVDVNFASLRTLAGLIRATYRVRTLLPGWDVSYKKSWRRARELGRAPEALFVGLPKPADE